MKRTISIISVVLMCAILLSACLSTEESTEKSKQMLSYLANNDIDSAMQLLSPLIIEDEQSARQGLEQIAQLLQGRTVAAMKQTYVYNGLKVDSGFSGTEQRATYSITLNDGTACQLQTIYYAGSGFVTFYLSFEDPVQPQGEEVAV